MSVGCSVPIDGGRAARRLRVLAFLIPALGLLTSLVSLLSGPPAGLAVFAPESTGMGSLARNLLMAALATGALGFAWRALRVFRKVPAQGSLELTESGLAVLDVDQVFSLHSVARLPGLIVVVLTPIFDSRPKLALPLLNLGRDTVLLLGQDALTPDQWRRLQVWLLWVERGALSASV